VRWWHSPLVPSLGMAAAIGLSAAGGAEEATDSALSRLLPLDQPICYMRQSDPARLKAAQRDQPVFLAIRRGFSDLAIEKTRREAALKDTPQAERFAEVSLRAAFRDTGGRRFESSATCTLGDGGDVTCVQRQCDGSAFQLKRINGEEVELQLPPSGPNADPFRLGCDSEAGRHVLAMAPDDQPLLLRRAALAQCR
jgi:hypothetical protein